MAKRHYGKSGRLHVTLPCEVLTLLDYAARVMGASSSEIARVALISWLSKPTRQAPKQIGRDISKVTESLTVYVWPQVEGLVNQLSDTLQSTPSQIVRAAIVDWFQNAGGDLVYQVDSSMRVLKQPTTTKPVEKPKRRPSKPQPVKPKPVAAEEPEESLEQILRQQLAFYQRCGNPLRVAQITRQLQQLEDAA